MVLFYVCSEVDKEDSNRLVLCDAEQGVVHKTVKATTWLDARIAIGEIYKHIPGHGYYDV
jgi:hypothetical protein